MCLALPDIKVLLQRGGVSSPACLPSHYRCCSRRRNGGEKMSRMRRLDDLNAFFTLFMEEMLHSTRNSIALCCLLHRQLSYIGNLIDDSLFLTNISRCQHIVNGITLSMAYYIESLFKRSVLIDTNISGFLLSVVLDCN